MSSKWQHKYEEEAERLVVALRRWYDLETEVRDLEWKLNRCRHPQASSPAAPREVEKPMLLRRAEANKPLASEHKQGRLRSWKDRVREIMASRAHYEDDNRRLASRVQGLTMLLAEYGGSADKRPHSKAGGDRATSIDQVRQALQVEHASEAEYAPEERDEKTLGSPIELDRVRHQLRRLQEQHRTLQHEKETVARQGAALQQQVDALTKRLDRKEKVLQERQDVIADLEGQKAQAQQRFEALGMVHELARRFLQGQRSFLFLHNDPHLENALAGLIDYSLARLAASLATDDKEGVLALCANLDAVATRLQTYKGAPVYGLDTAREMLPALRDQARVGDARLPSPSPERQRPEAKPFLVRLKYLRDVARLDLRPFYYLDDQNQVQRIG